MRKLSLLFVLILLSSLLVFVVVGQEGRSLPRDLDVEMELITALNQYRVRDGRGPLLRNPDLDYLARIQAEYMQQWLPLTEEELDYHADRFGDGIIRRAELIDWPTYGFGDAPFVGEIAAYFPSVQGMMDFWNNSQDHRDDIYAYGYREVGVTVLRNGNWFLAYVVFGARPDVLPVFYDAQLNKLVLTTDQSPFIFNRFVPTLVQIQDEAGQRLHVEEWLPWRSRVALPEGAGQIINVIYSDGVREVHTTVDLYQALLYPSLGRGSRRLSTLTVVTGTPRATVTPMPPTPTWTPSPEPIHDQYDIVLHYDATSLNFINQSGEELNLLPLSIVVPGMGAISAEWMGAYSEVPLTQFPDQYCMQLWSSEQRPSSPAVPEECHVMASSRSVLTVNQLFWIAGHFEVTYYGAVIASCQASLHTCSFDIPRN